MNGKVLAIIPARAGSKGVKNKNILRVAGKPLIGWTIDAAKRSKFIDRIVVSTDGTKIATVARRHGAEVPFLRPPELATDMTPGIDPVIHAVRWLEYHEGYKPEYILLLQPTSPLRTTADIDSAIKLAQTSPAGSVVSVCEVKQHPYWSLKLGKQSMLRSFLNFSLMEMQKRFPRRQDLPPAYAENGAIYLVRRSILLKSSSFYSSRVQGIVMPVERSLDIDTPLDVLIAKQQLRTSN